MEHISSKHRKQHGTPGQFLSFHSEIQRDGAWWSTLTDVMATFCACLQLSLSFKVPSPHPSGHGVIEGFGGKRAVGILRKIELCQKRSKFRMQFCLGVLNNVLHVFSLKLASFLRYYVCEKTHFSEGIL